METLHCVAGVPEFGPVEADGNYLVCVVCLSVTFMLMSALLLPEPALLRVCSDFHAIFANALPDIRPTYLYPLYPLIYPGTGIKEGFWSFHENDLDLIYLLQISYTTDYISSPHPQTNTR